MNILEINGLTKKFGDFKAVDNIDLHIEKGEIYGLLGPNGAGKSTTINMICGLLSPTEGSMRIFDKDVKKEGRSVKQKIGVVPQDIAVYEDLTAYENAAFFGSLYKMRGKELKSKVEEALEFVGLKDKAKEYPSKFSGGMKRRLNIACALVHNPELIIMDEPTVGIDPQSRNHILASIKKLNEMGCTIIYTSHYMEEVEEICTRIAIIDNGKIIAEGTKEQLKASSIDTSTYMITLESSEKVEVQELEKIDGVSGASIAGNVVKINSSATASNLDKIIMHFTRRGIAIKNIDNRSGDLETVFLNLTGRKLRD